MRLQFLTGGRPIFYVTALGLAACLVLGGGTRDGFLSDSLLELIAVPLLTVAIWYLGYTRLSWQAQCALVCSLAIPLVPLLQLIPLPPSIWAALPNREPIAAGFELLGRKLPWLPVSVSPHLTWLAALSLIPPFAVFLGTLQLSFHERRRLSLVLLGFGVISAFTGLMQVAQGPGSRLRFFEITNATEAVGFFANRNHFAALLYCLILIAAAWGLHFSKAAGGTLSRRRYETAAIVPLVACLAVLVILVATEIVTRSRAGLGLTILALTGAVALNFRERRLRRSGATLARMLIIAVAIAVFLGMQFSLYRLLDRFGTDPLADARVIFARRTVALAEAFMPFGSGMGTFVPVYATGEPRRDAIANTFANRAHDDILELWLEAGVFGLAIAGLFAGALLPGAAGAWRISREGGQLDHALARGATLVIVLLTIHSTVDYPLRTGAMLAVFALAAGLIMPPPPVGVPEPLDARDQRRGKKRRSSDLAVRAEAKHASAELTPPAAAARPAAGVPAERWGRDVVWPEEWREPPQGVPQAGHGPGAPRGKDDQR